MAKRSGAGLRLASSVRTRVQGIRRSLSPWVRGRLTRRRTRSGARRRRTITGAHTGRLVQRVQRVVERSVVWRPDVGSVEPAMVARFSGEIVNRFPSIGDKYRMQVADAGPEEDLEMPLPGGRRSGEPVRPTRRSTPSRPAWPTTSRQSQPGATGETQRVSGTRRPQPAQPSEPEPPASPKPERLRHFSQVEEVVAPDEAAAPPPDSPEAPVDDGTSVSEEASSASAPSPEARRSAPAEPDERPRPAVSEEDRVADRPDRSGALAQPAAQRTVAEHEEIEDDALAPDQTPSTPLAEASEVALTDAEAPGEEAPKTSRRRPRVDSQGEPASAPSRSPATQPPPEEPPRSEPLPPEAKPSRSETAPDTAHRRPAASTEAAAPEPRRPPADEEPATGERSHPAEGPPPAADPIYSQQVDAAEGPSPSAPRRPAHPADPAAAQRRAEIPDETAAAPDRPDLPPAEPEAMRREEAPPTQERAASPLGREQPPETTPASPRQRPPDDAGGQPSPTAQRSPAEEPDRSARPPARVEPPPPESVSYSEEGGEETREPSARDTVESRAEAALDSEPPRSARGDLPLVDREPSQSRQREKGDVQREREASQPVDAPVAPVARQDAAEVDVSPAHDDASPGDEPSPAPDGSASRAGRVEPPASESAAVPLELAQPEAEQPGAARSQSQDRPSIRSLRSSADVVLSRTSEPTSVRRKERTGRRLPLTHEVVTDYLESRGYRFKRKSKAPSETTSERVVQAAEDLERTSGTGRPLDEGPRTLMEGTLGRDFGDVRVHQADLGPLNVQAASRGRDVYVEPGQERFDTPESLGVLGHELTHVAQQGGGRTVSAKVDEGTSAPAVTPLPLPQRSSRVAREEAEADEAEQFVMRALDTATAGQPGPEDAEEPDEGADEGADEAETDLEEAALSPDELAESPTLFLRQQVALLAAAQLMADDEEYPPALYANLLQMAPPDLDDIADEGVITEDAVESIEGMAALLEEIDELELGEGPAEASPNLDRLARQVYPLIKRMMALEHERRIL